MKKDYLEANEEFNQRVADKSKKNVHGLVWIPEEEMLYHVCHGMGMKCDVPDDVLSKKAKKQLKKK